MEPIRLRIAGVAVALSIDDPAFADRVCLSLRRWTDAGDGLSVRYRVRSPWTRPHQDRPDAEILVDRDEARIVHRDFAAVVSVSDLACVAEGPCRLLSIENLLRVLVALRLCRTGGLLMHSSGAIVRGRAIVLFGPSGSGKSTSARLARGRTVLGDDLVAIGRGEDGWWAHGTPFGGASRRSAPPRIAPIGGLYRIAHGSTFHSERVASSIAASALIRSTVLPLSWPGDRQKALDTAADLARDISVRELRFPVDNRLWRFLDDDAA